MSDCKRNEQDMNILLGEDIYFSIDMNDRRKLISIIKLISTYIGGYYKNRTSERTYNHVTFKDIFHDIILLNSTSSIKSLNFFKSSDMVISDNDMTLEEIFKYLDDPIDKGYAFIVQVEFTHIIYKLTFMFGCFSNALMQNKEMLTKEHSGLAEIGIEKIIKIDTTEKVQ